MIAVLLAWLAVAGPLSDGAERWERGDAAGAIEVWSQAAAQGPPSGVLLYDLGVAHYRIEDHARAVAYWRAARRMRPRDPQLVHNLARARNQIDGAPEPVAEASGWTEFATPGELGGFGLVLLAVGAGGLWWRRRQGADRSRGPWMLAGAAGVAVTCLALTAAWGQLRHPVAVVVDNPAVAREAARADAVERFELPPGSEVRVDAALGRFLLVETGDGDRGWVPRDALLVLSPDSPWPAG